MLAVEVLALHLGQVNLEADFAVEGGELHRHAHDLILGPVQHLGLDFGSEGANGAEELHEGRVNAGRGPSGRHLSDRRAGGQHEQGERNREPRL